MSCFLRSSGSAELGGQRRGGTAPGSVPGAETTGQELQLLRAPRSPPWAPHPHTEGGSVSLLGSCCCRRSPPASPWGHVLVLPAHAAGATRSSASDPGLAPSPAPVLLPVLLPS